MNKNPAKILSTPHTLRKSTEYAKLDIMKSEKVCHKDCYRCNSLQDCCGEHCICGEKMQKIGEINRYDILYQCPKCKTVEIQ